MRRNDNDLASLTRKLGSLAELDRADQQAILSLPMSIDKVEAGRHLVEEGSRPSECCVLIEGYACRYKVTLAGERQIVSFHIPGDILDLQHLHLALADHHVQSITSARVAWLPKSELKALARQRPNLAEALWRDSLIDASIFREWVLNVGRRKARSRIAHMLCEFAVRCESAGLGPAATFRSPMTQEHIADATGLTPVHVNRTLRSLREDHLLEAIGGRYRIKNWSGLKRVAEFDGRYLHAAAA
jgi:CRP-like cAMP-binding protein